MPLYEYECDACGHRFEQIRRFSDPPLADCPKCEGAVRKLVSSPAIQFKGTGWYVTDYAKKGASGPAAGEAGGASDSEGKDSKGTDGKTQAGKKKDGTDKAAGKDTSSKSPSSSGSSSSSSD